MLLLSVTRLMKYRRKTILPVSVTGFMTYRKINTVTGQCYQLMKCDFTCQNQAFVAEMSC